MNLTKKAILLVSFSKDKNSTREVAYLNRFDELLKRIDELREEMYKSIERYEDLQDSCIIEISKQLDKHLVEYERLLADVSEKD